MRIARYSNRFSVTLRQEEYIDAHRRFARGCEKLRASVETVSDASGKFWVKLHITGDGPGNQFYRHTSTGDWVVQFAGDSAPNVPQFGASDVGRLNLDKDGVDLILIPVDRFKQPFQAPEEDMPKATPAEFQPTPTDTVGSHVSLEQVYQAVAILKKAADQGITVKIENGRVTGFDVSV